MKLPNIYGYGQLFGYSGIEGKNYFTNDFAGTLAHEHVGVRFELSPWIKFVFPCVPECTKFEAVLGDMLLAEADGAELSMIFVEGDTVVGQASVLPEVTSNGELNVCDYTEGVKVYTSVRNGKTQRIAFAYKLADGAYRYCIRYMRNSDEALYGIDAWLECDLDAEKSKKTAYLANMPRCKRPEYEQLYYKCLSVQKVNICKINVNI